MTQQGLRQASARDLSGFATETNYNEDLLRLFDAQSIPAGTFNERQLRWINARMAASYTNLTEAMQAYATSQGAYNWSALGALENTVNFTRAMPFGSTYTRAGSATALTTAGVIQTFAANAPQRTDRGLALEHAATNLLLRSQEFGTTWSQTNLTTVTANSAVAPDGTTTADTIVANVTLNQHRLDQTPVSGAGAQTLSVFAKPAGYNFAVIRIGLAGGGFAFNVNTGAIVGGPETGVTATLLAASAGFYRCVVAVTSAAANAIARINTSDTSNFTFTGDGVSGSYLWQAQLEAGSVATSPIVTTAAQASRSLPVFTEPVPAGRTKALLTYADASTTLVTGLTPGGTFDVATAVIAAGKGRFGASELISRTWQA
jgi:hypothetical protein